MTTVNNPVSDVYEKWKAKIVDIVGEGNFSVSNNETLIDDKRERYAQIFLLGNPTASADLTGNETSTSPSFQTDSFANGVGALSTAYEIDAVSHAAMVGMGFQRTYGPQEIKNIDSNIKRVTSRYSRIYTGQL